MSMLLDKAIRKRKKAFTKAFNTRQQQEHGIELGHIWEDLSPATRLLKLAEGQDNQVIQ